MLYDLIVAALRQIHSIEKEGGPTLGLISPVYDSYQYFWIGHWTYACDRGVRCTRRGDAMASLDRNPRFTNNV
jgi:hypothetical protein